MPFMILWFPIGIGLIIGSVLFFEPRPYVESKDRKIGAILMSIGAFFLIWSLVGWAYSVPALEKSTHKLNISEHENGTSTQFIMVDGAFEILNSNVVFPKGCMIQRTKTGYSYGCGIRYGFPVDVKVTYEMLSKPRPDLNVEKGN